MVFRLLHIWAMIMIEWVLIAIITTGTISHPEGGISISFQDGFKSKESCQVFVDRLQEEIIHNVHMMCLPKQN